MSEYREFRIEDTITVHASAERVWAALTEAEAAWMFPTDDWPASYPVREEPHRLVSRMDAPDGWFNELEQQINTGPDSTTSIRWIHSGVFAEDWDRNFDAAAKHTTFYLHTLGEYLRHFDGRPVTFTDIQGKAPEAEAEDAYPRVLAALGIRAEGEVASFELPGRGPVTGVVDYLDQNFAGIRTPDALIRVFARNNFGSVVGLSVHDFATDAASPATTAEAYAALLASALE